MEDKLDLLQVVISELQQLLAKSNLSVIERIVYQERLKGLCLAYSIISTGKEPTDLYKL